MSGRHLPVVRPAQPRDAALLAALHVRVWQAAYRGLLDEEFLQGLSAVERERSWRDRLADPAVTTLVAEHAGGLAGFVVAGRSRQPADPPSTSEIYSIYVEQASWRTGIGSALLARAIEALRVGGFSQAVLWVLSENLRARAFYEAQGFAAGPSAGRTVVIGGRACAETRYAMRLDSL